MNYIKFDPCERATLCAIVTEESVDYYYFRYDSDYSINNFMCDVLTSKRNYRGLLPPVYDYPLEFFLWNT